MTSTRAAWQIRLSNAYLVIRLLQAGALLAYLIGSLVLTGGRVVESKSAIWGALLPFPLFTIPGWAMLAVSICAAVLALPLLLITRSQDPGQLRGVLATTGAGFCAWLIFAAIIPSGAESDDWQWIAVRLDGALAAIFLAASLIHGARLDRANARAQFVEGAEGASPDGPSPRADPGS